MIWPLLLLVLIAGIIRMAIIEIKKAAIIDQDSINKLKKTEAEKAVEESKANIQKSNESIKKADLLSKKISNQLKKGKK